jgi:hypothetical protein
MQKHRNRGFLPGKSKQKGSESLISLVWSKKYKKELKQNKQEG